MAKCPMQRAIAAGVAPEVGSLEVGKGAERVLWEPAFFGIKPTLILKGGMIALAQMGDPNASIPTPQPVHYREMFATRVGALARTSLTFVSQMAAVSGIPERYGLAMRFVPLQHLR